MFAHIKLQRHTKKYNLSCVNENIQLICESRAIYIPAKKGDNCYILFAKIVSMKLGLIQMMMDRYFYVFVNWYTEILCTAVGWQRVGIARTFGWCRLIFMWGISILQKRHLCIESTLGSTHFRTAADYGNGIRCENQVNIIKHYGLNISFHLSPVSDLLPTSYPGPMVNRTFNSPDVIP